MKIYYVFKISFIIKYQTINLQFSLPWYDNYDEFINESAKYFEMLLLLDNEMYKNFKRAESLSNR